MNIWFATLAHLQSLDSHLFHVLNSRLALPGIEWLMLLLSNKKVGLWLAAGLATLVLWRSGRRWAGALVLTVTAVFLSDLSASLLKVDLHRVRPCHVFADVRLLAGCTWSFGLPSNHASNLWAIATAAWAVRAPWRWPVLLLAGAVGYSRVYLGVHYPGDVLAGAIVGAGVTGLLVLMLAAVRATVPPLGPSLHVERRPPATTAGEDGEHKHPGEVTRSATLISPAHSPR